MDYIKTYTNFLEGFLDVKGKIKVVFDCSDGTAGLVVGELFKDQKDVEVFLVNEKPDGDFPNHGPNPLAKEAKEALKKEVLNVGADLGVMFDSDADRVFFADEKGELIDSYTSFSCIKDSFKPPYVLDVRAMASVTMDDLEVIEEQVGRYFIIKAMIENDAALGVEYTGHFYFKDFFYSDSGILAAIYMINSVSNALSQGQKLSDLTKREKNFVRSDEINFEVEDPKDLLEKAEDHFSSDARKVSKKDGLTIYGEDFALNLRSSNTEPVVRLNVVAKGEEEINRYLQEVERLIKS